MPETTTDKPNYKKTLNLPQTSFPMRANLAQNEPQSRKRWEKMNLYQRVLETRENEGGERFTFHDGPPYTSGSIHVGHLLNKVLKDFVVRTKLMQGFICPYVPGWDCHGLPIEHRVMTELVESGKFEKLKSLDDDTRRMAVRRECEKYAQKWLKLQMEQMKRLLTLADYDDPYVTMEGRYEKGVIEVFADLVAAGLVYRAQKPVHWSIANQTALAEAELEYEDRDDPSVFVDFDLAPGSKQQFEAAFGVQLDQTPSLMIWTTTPWTLPANLAVAVHERFQYSLVQVDGNITVIASDLVERVTQAAKADDVKVLAQCEGAKLIGLQYQHPFCERTGRVVAADYVTLEDGTGLVHTAPGHGQEDYQTGKKEGLDIYCPVREDGTFDGSVPEWLRGLDVWTANAEIVEHLQRSGHLFHQHMITHSYPHDWRSKTPVIFRATEQWFVGVDTAIKAHGSPSVGVGDDATLRNMALDAVDNAIRFIPDWGRNRMRGMLESRPDWCISRQRSWGLPIPAFYGPEKGQVLLTPASVRAVAQLFGEKGSDAWFELDAAALLTHYEPKNDPDAPDWLGHGDLSPHALTKSEDIFDVWFESGSSWNAVLRQRDLGYPADLYLEGSDQHRGWFQLSLLPALGATGQPPFKQVLTHGFTVDKHGKKMSKSIGNAIEVEDLLKDYGAEVARWWVSTVAYEGDIKMDLSFFDTASESYRKVRNTLRFLLSNLADFTREMRNGFDFSSLPATSLDRYAIAECARVQKVVLDAYNAYHFRKAQQVLYDFCNETLSALYCAAVKDRLYCDKPDSPRRRATQAAMWAIAESLCRVLAPLLPHTADEAWRALMGDEKACVHLETVQTLPVEDADPAWATVMSMRERVLKALEEAKTQGIENPLDAGVVVPDPDGVLKAFVADLADAFGVSRVTLDGSATEVTVQDLRNEPRCDRSWKRDGTVKQRAGGGMLSDRDAEAVGVQ